jgi:Reverse transcriptase (RNA-dependent DNA polymerase)
LATPAPPLTDTSPEAAAARAHHERVESSVAGWLAQPFPDDPVLDAPVSRAEIERAVGRLQRYKSPGSDGLPNELLREGGNPVLNMLVSLFRIIWKAELVPTAWRQGVITSLYKAGDRTDCSNYRPITLLPVVDKLFTSILAKRLETAVPLHDHQSAFRPKRGTMDPIFVLTSTVLHRKLAGLRTHAFFLDLKKAYDLVWHAGLFYKLHHKGVKAKLWRVIWDLYSKCTSAARLDGQTSASFPILQGVAQGCPMSCILFNVMIDDLIETLQSRHHADGITFQPPHANLVAQGYADDIACISPSRAGLQRAIDTCASHLALWKGVVNVAKSPTLVFNPSGASSTPAGNPVQEAGDDCWLWGSTPLPQVSKVKYLGLILTSDCSWKEHAAYAASKGHAAYAAWKSVLRNPLLSLRSKLSVITACIKPCITYGMEVWAPPAAQRDSLEMPLRHALRAALGVPYGVARSHYPVDLMHYDTAVRPVASENRAAHVRFWQRVRTMPESRLQRRVFETLQPGHPWVARAHAWRDELVAADPAAAVADALSAPAPPPTDTSACESAGISNRVLNIAVAQSDTTRYLEASRTAGRPVLTLAMRDRPCTRPQPYMQGIDVTPFLLFRCGRFARDVIGVPDAGEQPCHTHCPDCSCVVTCPDDDFTDAARAFRMVLHRITSCAAVADLVDWYHDVAVRLAPAPGLARTLVDARKAEGLWAAGENKLWEAHCLPFLRFVLSPTCACPPADVDGCRRLLEATRLFLSTSPGHVGDLPAAATFGDVPGLDFWPDDADLSRLTPGVVDVVFWEMVERHVPPVPQALPGLEAEAPWVRFPRRASRRGGQGVIPD